MSTIESIITDAGSDINTSAGIVITDFLAGTGNYWLIGDRADSNTAFSYETELDINIIGENTGYFIGKDFKLILVNSLDALGEIDTTIGPYSVPFNANSSFNFFVVSNDDLITARNTPPGYTVDASDPTYPIADEPIFVFSSQGIAPLFVAPPDTSIKPIYQYTPEQQKTLTNTNESSLRVKIKTNETITADILKDVSDNPILPQFKSFKDYMAYKNSLSNRIFLKNKFQ